MSLFGKTAFKIYLTWVFALFLLTLVLSGCLAPMTAATTAANTGTSLLGVFKRNPPVQPQPTIEQMIREAEAKKRLCEINRGYWHNGLCLDEPRPQDQRMSQSQQSQTESEHKVKITICLLYTSDAADE